jgi:hypothetical protein
MPLYVQNGNLIQKAGALGSSAGCCCTKVLCILQQSGVVPGFSGSSVAFSGNGDPYKTLNFFGVTGYWLGAYDYPDQGVTQSITITFGSSRPTAVRVRVSGLDNALGGETFNYSFAGATTTTFSVESGAGFSDTGSSVTRAASGDARFRLDASGDITQIFVEGEMTSGGSNGVIVEVCVYV